MLCVEGVNSNENRDLWTELPKEVYIFLFVWQTRVDTVVEACHCRPYAYHNKLTDKHLCCILLRDVIVD